MVIKMQVSWSTTFSVASCPLSCGCSLARSLYSYLQAVGKHSNAPRNYPSRPKHHPFHLHGVGCLNTPSPSPCILTCLAKERKKRKSRELLGNQSLSCRRPWCFTFWEAFKCLPRAQLRDLLGCFELIIGGVSSSWIDSLCSIIRVHPPTVHVHVPALFSVLGSRVAIVFFLRQHPSSLCCQNEFCPPSSIFSLSNLNISRPKKRLVESKPRQREWLKRPGRAVPSKEEGPSDSRGMCRQKKSSQNPPNQRKELLQAPQQTMFKDHRGRVRWCSKTQKIKN